MSAGRIDGPCVACGRRGLTFRFAIGGERMYRCDSCRTHHVRPLPDAMRLHEYYDEEYALVGQVGADDAAAATARARTYPGTTQVAGLIARHVPAAHRVAEVGCSSGYLLWGLRERGYDVEGFELSATTSELARRMLGLTVHTTAAPPAERAGAYDVIVMRHVLEHVLDPAATIADLGRALAPGGALILATPNVDSFAARVCAEDWEWMSPPAHLHLFTPRGLRALLERGGLTVLGEETRRGDARPFAVALLRRAASRLAVRRALTSRFGTLQPDGGGGAVAGRLAGLRGGVMALAEACDRLGSPLGSWVARRGAAEELWMVARR